MNPVLAGAAGAVSVLMGLLVLQAGRRPVGWLLVAHGVSFGVILGLSRPSTGRVGLIADQLLQGAWVFLFFWLALLAYVVPDGRVASVRWRRWVQAGLAGVIAFLIGAADDQSGFRDAHHGVDPPLSWPPTVIGDVLGGVGLVMTFAFLVGAVVAVWVRLRRATGEVRLQLLWLVWGATSIPIALGLEWTSHFLLSGNVWVSHAGLLLGGLGLPVSIGVGIVRHRLFDIQLVLSRTLVYGALTFGVVATYAAILAIADAMVGRSRVGGLVAVGVVAVAVQPAHAFLRRRVECWVYGDRRDPGAALRRLSQRVEGASDPAGVVTSVTDAVAEALRIDRARIARPAATCADNEVAVPLVHRGEALGDLVVSVPHDRALSAEDVALLHDLAGYAAVVVRAAELTSELQASRAGLVAAREEERRRLRRDLHDGVGPSLAAIVLTLGTARERADPVDRDQLLSRSMEEARSAIAEVRRLVDDLRPPAIDEVGLLGAVRQRVASLTHDTDLVVEVVGPARMPSLPAAVEVAAFRIAVEAVTNALRHASARRCSVRVETLGAFELTVIDDGHGERVGVSPGVGWTSMSQRAEELGGSCTMTSPPHGGLVVRAVLPLDPAPVVESA